ncbi:NUDIX hydrolase [Fodinibius sediminis]|uniref:Predicted NTP pyrophosphohydrolase, NUDIX family n=1 Tax=Fodinibius sediminis TaxID=1214077 RepID=A0A521DIN0_9BACT|nr:NUDIX domain-containing protein [Fodinibius sediminis]SMO71569.1 Predicted NTP pyrophosphohydrolase, NUDIX family [Fodinibius sediminis]
MQKVTAAGGVLIRYKAGKADPEVLLIFRRGVWDLPKGKREEDESVEACAVREVAEEIGISSLPEILSPLVDTYHEYRQDGVLFGKTTHWFAMQLAESEVSFTPERREGIQKVAWHSLTEAKHKVGYPNLLEVLDAVEAL